MSELFTIIVKLSAAVSVALSCATPDLDEDPMQYTCVIDMGQQQFIAEGRIYESEAPISYKVATD